MCGIVGYSGQVNAYDKFVRLCQESCVRGVHAFGIAYIQDNQIVVYKSNYFNDLILHIPNPIPSKIVFHNRYSTSGDHEVMANNQPIYKYGEALVFNGTIDMGTKSEMERRYNVALDTCNDGELALIDAHNDNKFRLLENTWVTFAGIYMKPDGTMTAYRNSMRPLWRHYDNGGCFITSTLDIAKRSGIDVTKSEALTPFLSYNV